MLTTLALAPGLFANVILKDHWSRPRPIDVPQFGGAEPFVAWWDPRGVCPKNCSFVTGDGSGAFWTMAPAALAPPAWRPAAYAAAIAFGAGVGLLRMSFGGHFFSDVVFAGVFTFLIIWLMHGYLYRWPRTRTTDEAIERGRAARDLGVDAVFVEAPESVAELERIARDIPGVTLVANMVETGRTPLLSPAELAELGFTLIVSPLTALFTMVRAVQESLALLQREGTLRSHLDRLVAFEEFGALVDLPGHYEMEQRFGR